MSSDRTPPRISIVTPSYNQAEYLRETIESILRQGYPNLEYLIVDGGSTDGSVAIIEEYQRDLSYWVSEKDRGQSHAIMKGFERSTGELFAWVNSDDVLFADCLRTIADRYCQSDAPDIVHGNVAYIDARGQIARFVRIPRQSRFFVSRGIWYAQAPAVFFKASRFQAAGGVNERFYQAMDFDLWMRLMKTGAKVAHVSRYLGGFRWHQQSKSSRNYLVSAAKSEDPEETEIIEAHLPHLTPSARRTWRRVYKAYQALNLNYLRAYLNRRRLGGKLRWDDPVVSDRHAKLAAWRAKDETMLASERRRGTARTIPDRCSPPARLR